MLPEEDCSNYTSYGRYEEWIQSVTFDILWSRLVKNIRQEKRN